VAAGTSGQGNITGSNGRLMLDFDVRRNPRNPLWTSIRMAAAWTSVSRLAFLAPSMANTRDYARLTAKRRKTLIG
jgi:hypothetical protein